MLYTRQIWNAVHSHFGSGLGVDLCPSPPPDTPAVHAEKNGANGEIERRDTLAGIPYKYSGLTTSPNFPQAGPYRFPFYIPYIP